MAQDDEQTCKFPYPLDPNSYRILQEIGTGVSGTVYKAACLPMNSSVVAIKAIDLERARANLDDVRRETKAMTLLSHPNILRAHCSFTVNHHLWVVMPFMSAGSLHSIISSSFPDGLNESSIAVVLKETLNALLYLHDQGHLHRDIKAGNILVDSDGSVKLADFGVSASIYEPNPSKCFSSSSSNLMFNDVAGTPYWMAPEVIHSHVGYSFKADIWSFGITALELAHGRPPLSHLPPGKSLFMRITNRLRFSDYEKNKKDKNKKFSKNFKDMVASCLAPDPSKRPTAEKLRKHPFFKNCKNVDFLVKNMLQGLSTVEERYREIICHPPQVAIDDEDNGDDEESLTEPLEKHRRISGWNFNEEVLKLEPVFPIETEGDLCQTSVIKKDDNAKQVRFGEEMIIQGTNNQNDFKENSKNVADPSISMPPPSCFKDEVRVDTDANDTEKVEGQSEIDEAAIRGNSYETQTGFDEADADVSTDMIEDRSRSTVEEQEEYPTNARMEGVMVAAAPLVPGLRTILDGLEVERLLVSDLINRIGGINVGEMSHEEQLEQMVVQLSLQLDQERRRSALLEMELGCLRRKIVDNFDQINHDA